MGKIKIKIFTDKEIIHYNDCNFDRTNFHKLHTIAVNDNHFMFNDNLYDKIDGVAMGSPLGPTHTVPRGRKK